MKRLLGAAVLVRALVVFVALGAMPMVSDAADYVAVAAQLAAGERLGAFYWPPGASFVLVPGFAVFGPSVVFARIVTIALGVAAVALVARLGRALAGGLAAGPRAERAGLVAGWMAALYPPSVLLAGQASAQHLAALCLAAVAYFGLRAAREPRPAFFALTGLALGLGCLTRPSMVSVAPVVAIAWGIALARRTGARERVAAGLGVAGALMLMLACVLPVCAHDAHEGAGFTVSTNNERNLFLGNNPYTPDYKTSHLGQRALDELDPGARAYLESYYTRDDSRAAMQHAAVAYVLEHPARTALRTLNRATSFWGFDYVASREVQKWAGLRTVATLPLLALEAGGYLAVMLLAIGGCFGALAAPPAVDREWRTWLLGLALAYEFPYALAFSGGTYHFPAMVLVLPLAGLAGASPRETWRSFRVNRAAWAAAAVFAAVQVQYAYYAVVMAG